VLQCVVLGQRFCCDSTFESDLRLFLDRLRIFIISFVRLTLVASRESYRGVEILLRRALSIWKALVDAVIGLMR